MQASIEVEVRLIVTSAPVPGVIPITITDRVNIKEVDFTKDYQVIHVDACQLLREQQLFSG